MSARSDLRQACFVKKSAGTFGQWQADDNVVRFRYRLTEVGKTETAVGEFRFESIVADADDAHPEESANAADLLANAAESDHRHCLAGKGAAVSLGPGAQSTLCGVEGHILVVSEYCADHVLGDDVAMDAGRVGDCHLVGPPWLQMIHPRAANMYPEQDA